MSALSDIFEKEHPTPLDRAVLVSHDIPYFFKPISEDAAKELAELRRLVALLTTEPLHITRADIDAAKRILQKAEE